MYRNGTSVTRTMVMSDGRSSHSRSHEPSALLSMAPTRNSNTGRNVENSLLPLVEQKLDQMMEMISSNQRMLVEQQSSQIIIGEKLEKVCADVQELQEQMSEVKSVNATASSSAEAKKKKRVPNQLSLAIKRLYTELDEDFKFDSKQPYSSEQNRKANDFICQQLKTKFGDAYELDVIKRSIYRYYESRRRLHNDSQPRRREQVVINNKNQRKKTFQKRLYDRRVKFTKNDEEKSAMANIDYRYMTEESEEEGTVRKHQLTWRSEGLTKLLHKLDKRSQKGVKGDGQFSLKERVDSSPAVESYPPLNAPLWAVSKESAILESVECEGTSGQITTPSGVETTTGSTDSLRRRISFDTIEQQFNDISSLFSEDSD